MLRIAVCDDEETICTALVIISRSGKRQNATQKAPNCFKESSSAQQGKHLKL